MSPRSPLDFDAWPAHSDRPPLVMGVLNATPDSFSDGGQFLDPGRASDHAHQMLAAGAAIIDIGGESTRPGVSGSTPAEQIDRVVPIIQAFLARGPAVLSVDTTLAPVAEAACAAGRMINDISAGGETPRSPWPPVEGSPCA